MKIIAFTKDINHADRYRNTLSSYTFRIVDSYDDLIIETMREEIVILMSIDECEKEIKSCITPLVEQKANVIILDKYPEYEKGKELVSLGIRAYGNLMMNDIHLKEAINTVMDGNVWLYPEFINETVNRMLYKVNSNSIESRLSILTQREQEVALLVLDKLSYSEISEKLNITLRTVKAHTKNIYDKFNVSNRLSFLLLFK